MSVWDLMFALIAALGVIVTLAIGFALEIVIVSAVLRRLP